MAKKGFNLSIYLIGMAVTVIGFCLPMFKIFGSNGKNGFGFINFNNSGFVTIGALLIIIGAVAGLVVSLLGKGDQLEWIALAVSVVGGIILVIGFNDNGIYKAIGKALVKNSTIGFWMVVAGWVVAAVGKVLKK
ncbi:MAG: hypothetical protein VZQ47_01140 [Treponema sp.]|nr:hypothetical protein [Treponema sp.]MEE3434148.1 hypothetical protein [Treponema sp.]